MRYIHADTGRMGNNTTMARRIAIASQKGGVGKTTTAINLAAGLAFAGKRCLVVDLDPQANATTGLGIEQPVEVGAADVLFRPARAVKAIVTGVGERLDVLPAGGPMRAAEARLLRSHGGRGPLVNVLARVQDDYDFIIVDCPPSLGALTTSALLTCESIIVPMQCEFYALEGLVQVVAAVQSLQSGRNPDLRIEGILFTMFDSGAPIGAEVMADVKDHFGDAVYQSVIPRDSVISEAPSHGLSILDYDIRSRGARAYLELTKEVLADG